MPIRPELRYLYRTPEYKAARARVVERAGDCCEQCGKPNGEKIETASWLEWRRPFMVWRGVASTWWCWHTGLKWAVETRDDSVWYRSEAGHSHFAPARVIRVVLTLAHLDHNPENNSDDNLRLLCCWCHLNYDKLHHKETRSARKDSGRPLLV